MLASLFSRLERRFGDPAERLTRREMLRASAAAGAGLFLRASSARSAFRQAGRVVVAGAGLGGLSAANELVGAGYDVTVIEPSYRLGGRVHTLDRFIKKKTVEAGGSMIGLNHPTWAACAERWGLNLVDIYWDADADAPIVLGGERLSNDKAKALWKEMKRALSTLNDDASRVDAYEPWKTPGAEALDRRTTAEWIAGLDASPECRRAVSIQLTAINGMSPDLQSYLANLAMVKGGGVEKYWTETDALHCAGGAQQLPEEMADELGHGRFILGQKVTAVQIGEDKATVVLSDGRKLEADDVVVAVPASLWDTIAFDPPFPDFLKVQMGLNTKFLTHVQGRFWEKDGLSHRGLGDGPISMCWEDTCNQPEDGGVCLTLYAGGAEAQQAIDRSDDEREESYLAALERLFPGARAQYVAAKFIDWRANPLARGSYSFPAPGQVVPVGPTLTGGLGRLHFAGEHCCYAFIGYMEGALQSGVRLARRLAERDGLVKRE